MRILNSATIIHSRLTSTTVEIQGLRWTGKREGSGNDKVPYGNQRLSSIFPLFSTEIYTISVLDMSVSYSFPRPRQPNSCKEQQNNASPAKGHCWGNSALCCLSVNP